MKKAEFLKMVEEESEVFPNMPDTCHNSYGAGLQAGIKDGWLAARSFGCADLAQSWLWLVGIDGDLTLMEEL